MDPGGSFIDDKSMLSVVTGTGGVGSGGGCAAGSGANLSNISVELCLVCGDRASGRHYGAISCEGCKGFFKRSIRKQLGYQCRGTMNCEVTKHHRNRCQFCRLQKCLASGMRSDSVQHERKPIIDKKELHSSINSTSAVTNSPSGSIYHHRSKGGTYSSHQNASSTTVSGSSAVAAAAAAAAAAENLATVFPVGFNFADLTQTLSKRALLVTAPYQQQTIKQPTADNFSCSPGTQTNDDDSMDNSGSGIVQNQNLSGNQSLGQENISTAVGVSTSATAAAAASLIQSSIEKHMINQSLELITGIQQQYDPTGNNSTAANTTITANATNNNSIIKDELIIDDYPRDLNDSGEIPDETVFDLPILPEGNVTFNLQIPTPVPSYLSLHYVCECGSRLLFLSVYWVKKIHAFQQLPQDIQVKLLRRHWVELFAIGLAQCSRTLSLSTIMTTLASNITQIGEMEKASATKIRKLSEHTSQLHQFVQSMQAMDLSEHEYAYIRLVMVFSPDNVYVKSQIMRTFIQRLQESALASFRNYLRDRQHQSHSHSDDRCSKVFLRLMQLCTLESDIIEELFFFSLVGQVQIENMIPYILKLGGGGV